MKQLRSLATAFVTAVLAAGGWLVTQHLRAAPDDGDWTFVVSGDSRNCGDVIMPAIAATAIKNKAAFFWHLGDLRAITRTDDDMAHEPSRIEHPFSRDEYLQEVWDDAVEHQIKPFGSIPFIISVGNHDIVAPKTRASLVLQFQQWFDQPMLKAQRLKDDPASTSLLTYLHWIEKGVAFYSLDNATADQFDAPQLEWFERLLAKDVADPAVNTVVVGMHKPFADSYAGTHSMDESMPGIESSRRVVADLQRVQNELHKKVYTLASHQHFYMEDYLSNDYWKTHGGRIPGWVIGTAGAPRYPIPPEKPAVAKTNVYGSLVATVRPDGEIKFKFDEVHASDIPAPIVARYGREFLRWCIETNTIAR